MTPAGATKKKSSAKVFEAKVEIDFIGDGRIENSCPVCGEKLSVDTMGPGTIAMTGSTCVACGSKVRVLVMSKLPDEKPKTMTDIPAQQGYAPVSILGIEEPGALDPFPAEANSAPLTVSKVVALQLVVFPLILAIVFGLVWLMLIFSGARYQDYIHIGKVTETPASSNGWLFIAPTGASGQVMVSDGTGGVRPSDVAHINPKFDLSMEVSEKCWMEITTRQADEGGEKLSGDYQANWSHTFKDLTSANVRAGCPGSVQFWVNGEPVNPDNKAEHPDKVGLYSFPQ